MSSLSDQKKALTNMIVDELVSNDGCIREAWTDLNDASREIIRLMKLEKGDAWLGKINLYKSDEGKPPIWQWDGGLVYNFGACFVLPSHDAELGRLILERKNAAYTGVKADKELLDPILDRVREIGGVLLNWS